MLKLGIKNPWHRHIAGKYCDLTYVATNIYKFCDQSELIFDQQNDVWLFAGSTFTQHVTDNWQSSYLNINVKVYCCVTFNESRFPTELSILWLIHTGYSDVMILTDPSFLILFILIVVSGTHFFINVIFFVNKLF